MRSRQERAAVENPGAFFPVALGSDGRVWESELKQRQGFLPTVARWDRIQNVLVATEGD